MYIDDIIYKRDYDSLYDKLNYCNFDIESVTTNQIKIAQLLIVFTDELYNLRLAPLRYETVVDIYGRSLTYQIAYNYRKFIREHYNLINGWNRVKTYKLSKIVTNLFRNLTPSQIRKSITIQNGTGCQTALHIANNSNQLFLRYLLKYINDPSDLSICNKNGNSLISMLSLSDNRDQCITRRSIKERMLIKELLDRSF